MKQALNVFAILLAISILTACGPGFQGNTGSQGPAGQPGAPGLPGAPAPIPTPAPAVDSVVAQVASILADENEYRESLGQTALTGGLSCQVVQVSGGQWLSSSSPGYNAGQGVLITTGTTYTFNNLAGAGFNQPNAASGPNAVLPVALQPLFIGLNYRIICSGQLVVLETEYMAFNMASDDGSILTIDGTQVINNDGNHGITTKAGTKLLREGVHTFSLQYAQSGAGQFALQLTADSAGIDSRLYAH